MGGENDVLGRFVLPVLLVTAPRPAVRAGVLGLGGRWLGGEGLLEVEEVRVGRRAADSQRRCEERHISFAVVVGGLLLFVLVCCWLLRRKGGGLQCRCPLLKLGLLPVGAEKAQDEEG